MMNLKKDSTSQAGTTRLFNRKNLSTLLLLNALLVGVFLYVRYRKEHVSPVELYHLTWKMVKDDAYDQGKLQHWQDWEHRFDAKIRTDDDAAKYLNLSLQILGDRYAHLSTSAESKVEAEKDSGHFVGVGIRFSLKTTSAGKIAYGSNREPLAEVDKAGNPKIYAIFPGSPAMRVGLKAGDSILAVNNKKVLNSTISALHDAIGKGLAGELVRFVILRDGKPLNVNVARAEVKSEIVSRKKLTAGNGVKVGYIRLFNFRSESGPEEMLAAVKSLRAAGVENLVIDLRSNPGGEIINCLKIVSIFVQSGVVATARIRTDGHFEFLVYEVEKNKLIVRSKNEGQSTAETVSLDGLKPLGAKLEIAILANSSTGSAAEMFSGALHDDGRAVIVGERTFGKGIAQSVFQTPNKTRFTLTSMQYWTPSGRWLGDGGNSDKSYGIVPDYPVTLNKILEDYAAPGDNQLAFAVELLAAKHLKRSD